MDMLFKAQHRRAILDSLLAKDGQSLSDLETRFEITRFGIMKHLGLLEDTGLIVARKVGRFKYHDLNPMPQQLAVDRWINLLMAPRTRTVPDLKSRLENAMTDEPARRGCRCDRSSLRQVGSAA